MRRSAWFLSTAGFFALLPAAFAQAPAAPAGTAPFDGTCGFVSATKLTETFVGEGGRVHPCPAMTGGPLVVANGAARYRALTGTVGPRGELTMQAAVPATGRRGGVAYTVTLTGTIDAAGAVHARRSGYGCSYDAVWQKAR